MHRWLFAVAAMIAAGVQTPGGTEIRGLVAHEGKLYASNGYWEDTNPAPGAQILVLDEAAGAWRVDHSFDERLPRGRRRHLAIGALADVTFRTDASGATLPAPAALLLASTWDVTGRRTVFVRDDRSGDWSATLLAEDRPSPNFLPQIRSFGLHRDRVTGADTVFAGDTRGIFSGTYRNGAVRWGADPELATDGLDAFPGLNGRLRISSFAETGGRLFAAIGQQVWVRQDGAAPRWTLLATNPEPHFSETGLRGLTAVDGMLIAAVEGNQSRIVRIDPASGLMTTDLDLAGFLDKAWGTRVSYVIAGYNDMAAAGPDRLIGLEAFIPPASPRPPGHRVLDVIHGLEAGGWFLIRHPGGRYELRELPSDADLVAVRAIVASPFANDAGAFYFAGYDANGTPAHGTGWIARADSVR